MLPDVMATMIKAVGTRVRVVGFADELVAGWDGRTGSIANVGMVKFGCWRQRRIILVAARRFLSYFQCTWKAELLAMLFTVSGFRLVL